MKYRADIDGLRALSVLGVVFYHYGIPPFSGGFVGVDVFFVISGFLIGSIILHELNDNDFSLLRFYERRIRRILPALFAVIFAVFTVAFFWFLPHEFEQVGRSIVSASLFVSNIFFWQEGTNYFVDPDEMKPLLHTWSLAIEEQFYLLAPLTLMILYWIRPELARRYVLIGALALACVVSLALNIKLSHARPMAAFYLTPPRAWELLLGVLLATGAFPQPKAALLRNVLGLAGLALVVFGFVAYRQDIAVPGYFVPASCFGAALIIQAGTAGPHLSKAWLAWRPLVFIGTISYSLYLWHWPILTFFKYRQMRPPSMAEAVALIAVSVIIAILSWRYIEQPFRKRALAPSLPKAYAFGAVATVCCMVLGWMSVTTSGLPQRIPSDIQTIADRTNYLHAFRHCHNRSPAQVRSGNVCKIGRASELPSFVIWGDSHADMYVPALAEAADRAGRSGVVMTMGSCTPLSKVRRANKSANADCEEFNAAVEEMILASNTITKVVLAGYWQRQATGTTSERTGMFMVDELSSEVSAQETARVFQRAVQRRIASMRDRQVYIIADIPDIGMELPNLIARLRLVRRRVEGIDLSVMKAKYLENQKAAFDAFEHVKKEPNVEIVYVDDVLCSADACPFLHNGQIVYRNADHLSTYGALLFTAKFQKLF